MNPLSVAVAIFLLKWSALLAVGWGLHAVCRAWHPRWRLMLWRSLLCGGLLLPLSALVPLSLFTVPMPSAARQIAARVETRAERGVATGAGAQVPSAPLAPALSVTAPSSSVGDEESTAATSAAAQSMTQQSAVSQPSARDESSVPAVAIPWVSLVVAVWTAGVVWATVRLLRLQLQLRRTLSNAVPASAGVQSRAWQLQAELGVRQTVSVRVSEAIASPCLCGVTRPVILLPRRLVDDLPEAELTALLSHELAHQCRHDLPWCIAWRVMRAIFWFHPLVWAVPDAHVLACEEEADRVAAARGNGGVGYAQLLAQLALRVVGEPRTESQLALSATSQIARRLKQLGRDQARNWRTRHSLAGLAVAAVLFVGTAGWQFAQGPGEVSAASKTPATAQAAEPAVVPAATVLVIVQDESGQPIEGATILPDGLRGRGEPLRGSHYGWRPAVHGEAIKVVTDREGKARVTYPVTIVPEEKLLTGELSFTVQHPEYAAVRPTNYAIDGSAKPVRLTKGIPIRVAGFYGPNHEPVGVLTPKLYGESRSVPQEEWIDDRKGGLVWRQMSPGKHFLHVSGRLASGEIVYSEGVGFYGEQRDAHDFVLEMKPGVRVEGRLDARVARPVKDGWVQLAVRGDDTSMTGGGSRPVWANGRTGYWWSYRPIAADGSFMFPSVPEGELKVIAYGEGFISTNGPADPPPLPPGARIEVDPKRRENRGLPQSFAAVRPLTSLEIKTEATATLTVTAKVDGEPLPETRISVWPNVVNLPTGSRLFAGGFPSSEAPFRTLSPLPEPVFSVKTDGHGVAVLRNVPAFTPQFSADHAQYALAVHPPKGPGSTHISPTRAIDLELAPGQNLAVEVTLQPKGKDFIGLSTGEPNLPMPTTTTTTEIKLPSRAMAGTNAAPITVPSPAAKAANPVVVTATVAAPAMPAGKTAPVAGQVTAGGAPLAGARVFVYTAGPKVGTSPFCPSCYPDCGKSAVTDASGNFQFAALSSTLVFRLLVVASGYAPQFVTKVESGGKPVVATLVPRHNVDAPPTQVVRGKVVDPQGAPVFGVVVEPYGTALNQGRQHHFGGLQDIDPLVVTDERGEFSLPSGTPVDGIFVHISARGFANLNRQLPVGEPQTITLTEGATLTGRVMLNGKPLPNVAVGVSAQNRASGSYEGHFEVGTDEEGRFRFLNLPPKVDYYFYGLTETIGARGSIAVRGLFVGGDGSVTDLADVAIGQGFRIAGQVLTEDGAPLPEQTRLLLTYDHAWDNITVPLGPDGRFEVDGVMKDAVSLAVRVPGYITSPKNRSYEGGNRRLTGRVEGDVTGLEVLLEKGALPKVTYAKDLPRYEAGKAPRDLPLRGAEAALGFGGK